MRADDLGRAWARQAQLDAEQGVIECRMCRRRAGLDEALTLWRNGALVFAVCDRCSTSHDVLLTPTEAGVEVRARRRRPVVIGGGP
ncbi:MAG: hypothetical protein KC583_05245 [Myxococcales bacterium]|nr:hypothetical protein [Myxococcales bacterium]